MWCVHNVNYFLDYTGENGASSEVSSLEEIVDNITKNPNNDQVEDDTTTLNPVTCKKTLKHQQHFIIVYCNSKIQPNFQMQ